MNRSKRMVLLSHCLLNANSKVQGYAIYGDILTTLLNKLQEKGLGIVQLPCPEQTYLGMARCGKSREEYNTHSYRGHCQDLLISLIDSIKDYKKNGYSIVGLIGIKGSPSCGVNYTYNKGKGGITKGKGVFIEVLQELLEKENIRLPFVEVDEANADLSCEYISTFLEK